MYNGKNDRLIFQFHVKNVSSSERAVDGPGSVMKIYTETIILLIRFRVV